MKEAVRGRRMQEHVFFCVYRERCSVIDASLDRGLVWGSHVCSASERVCVH